MGPKRIPRGYNSPCNPVDPITYSYHVTGNGIETGTWKREKCSQFDDLHVALFLAGTSCIIASGHVEVSLPLTVPNIGAWMPTMMTVGIQKWRAGNRK